MISKTKEEPFWGLVFTRLSLAPQGNEALKAKRYVEAVKHYNEAIRLDRSNATYFSNKALALMQLGR